MNTDKMKIGLAQIKPVWLHRKATTEKITDWIGKAAADKCELVIFGEAILPGYPFWVALTDGAQFNSPRQKEIFSYYMSQAVNIDNGDLDPLRDACRENKIALVTGIIELAADRGNHSLYCSRVMIDNNGTILSVHRKLMPTYEERLVWATGDGHGLQVHRIGPFTVGSLNCWENWMPLPRTSLYALGENLHVAIWPGNVRNTVDITRFIAAESRSFVVSVSGLMMKNDIPDDIPYSDIMIDNAADTLADGGSCIANPDGSWLIEPVAEKEELVTAIIDVSKVREERQNFDPSGHYSRPDVTRLVVDRRRQNILNLVDDKN